MRNMKLRLISAALATCMMASVIPASAVTAFADDVEDNTSVTTPAEDPMGMLIPNNNGTVYKITQPGTYQMHGTYDAPIDVKAAGNVIINITGTVDYVGTKSNYSTRNYAIRAMNPEGVLTVNNESGYTFSVKGADEMRGVLRVYNPKELNNANGGTAIVKGGFYQADYGVKETFYNHQGTLTLDHISVEGEVLVKNNGGTVHIIGGTYKRLEDVDRVEKAAIVNETDGTTTITDAEVSAVEGSAILNAGGIVEITGGSFSSQDENYGAIFVNKSSILVDGVPQTDAIVKINGATIKDSKRGLEAPNGKIVLNDITFDNNTSDIYLEANQELDSVVDMSDYDGKPLTAKVTTADGKDDTTLAVKPADLTVEGGTVKVDTSSIVGEATVNKDGDTTKASVPVKALVTVTYDEAAYADSNLKFNGWTITCLANADNYKNQQTFTFEMPANKVTITAGTATTDTEDDSWDAATIVTGVAIGAGAAVLTYHIGTELYAEQVLGKGVAVPKTREDVAFKAWELAGKPAVAVEGEPLSETAQAEKWAIESGLMQNTKDGTFHGEKKMNKLKALRVLDKAQKLNAQ